VGLLQLGEDFCLPTLNKERNTIKCTKAVENSFHKHKLNNNNTFRNMLFPLTKETKNDDNTK